MRLVRIDESQEVLDELFGKKKAAKKSKTAVKMTAKTNVQRNVFDKNTVKKWLSQAKYTGKDLADSFQDINDTAQLNLNKTVGVALYHNKRGNAMAVAIGLGKGASIGDLWIKSDLFSGEGSWSKVMDEFLKCEDTRDVENVLKKYRFSNNKTY